MLSKWSQGRFSYKTEIWVYSIYLQTVKNAMEMKCKYPKCQLINYWCMVAVLRKCVNNNIWFAGWTETTGKMSTLRILSYSDAHYFVHIRNKLNKSSSKSSTARKSVDFNKMDAKLTYSVYFVGMDIYSDMWISLLQWYQSTSRQQSTVDCLIQTWKLWQNSLS